MAPDRIAELRLQISNLEERLEALWYAEGPESEAYVKLLVKQESLIAELSNYDNSLSVFPALR